MADELTTSVALLVAAAGGAGALLGSTISTLVGHWSRRGERRQDQQRRDAEVVGPALAWLSDADPDRVGINLSRETEVQNRVMSDLRAQQRTTWADLFVMSAGHPNAKIREQARQLSVALHNAQTSLEWFVSDLLAHKADESSRATAKDDHAKARQLAKSLLDEIAKQA